MIIDQLKIKFEKNIDVFILELEKRFPKNEFKSVDAIYNLIKLRDEIGQLVHGDINRWKIYKFRSNKTRNFNVYQL